MRLGLFCGLAVLLCAFEAMAARASPSAAPSEGAGACPVAAPSSDARTARFEWAGWGAGPDNRRFQPAAGLTAGEVPRLRLKWAFGFEGASMAFSQPALAGGRLYVGSQSGRVFALDPRTGCAFWTFQASAAVRTGFAISGGGGATTVYFGDQHGAVYALDAASGRLLWKTQADPHPAAMITGTPQAWGGRLYVPVASYEENFAPDPHYACCTFRGSVAAYDARSGRLVWRTYLIPEPPHKTSTSKAGVQLWGPSGAAVWSSPTLDPRRGRIYVATGNNYSAPVTSASDAVVALSLARGRIVWTRQVTPDDAYNASCQPFMDPTRTNCPREDGPDFDFGASPILATLANGRAILVAAQKSGVVYGLDPVHGGQVVWRTRIGKGGPLGGVEWGAAADGAAVYAAVSDCDWRSFERIRDGRATTVTDLDPDKGGGLFALRLADGGELWAAPPGQACMDREHCSPAQLAAVTVIPGVVFSGSLDGHIRAYSTSSGRVLWDEDTAKTYSTVNGVPAHGGSLNGPGAVAAGGMVFVNSGYSRFGEAPGNVLLAFSVDGV